MSAERVIANLLRIAREDLEGARMLSTRGNRNAIYLCEQAAEKIIRAVLTSEKVHAGVRHQLDEMVGLVPDETRSSRAFVSSSISARTPRHTDTPPRQGEFLRTRPCTMWR
jgi:HEPN domain-containing protein